MKTITRTMSSTTLTENERAFSSARSSSENGNQQPLIISCFGNLLSASRYTAFAEQGVGLPGLFVCHSLIQSLLDLGPVTVTTGSRA